MLLLCPFAAAAAEWRYDGQMTSGPSAGAMKVAQAQSPAEDMSGGMNMPAGPAPAGAPTNNMTMAAVQAAKGQPERILEAVGDPPITRWQYPDYVVYFEHDRVITSVAGHL